MKKKFLMISIAICLSITAGAQWTIDSVNTAGLYLVSGATTSKAVFTNGGEWNVFDANTNTHSFGNLSISRAMVQTVTYGEKIYFGGGKYGPYTDPQYTKNVDVYNATANSWSTLNLSKNREVGGAGAAGNKIVFAGGTGRSDISGPVYMYATADIFDATTGTRTTGKLSKARSNIAVGASGNKIVFAGGWYWDMMYNVLNTNAVDIYDASTNTWTKASLSKKRENITVAVVGNKIIFAGGTGGSYGGVVSDVDVYDDATNTWTITSLPVARYAMKSVVIGDNAYFAGGAGDPVENAIDIYNAVNNTWATIYLPTSLSGFSMSVINDKIYFAGGYISGTAEYSDLVQIFDPADISWSTEHLSIPRNNIKALTCVNKGYFAGGNIAYSYPLPAVTKRVDIFSSGSPIADFNATATVIIAGETVNFIDESTNNPTSWSWTFNGGTPPTSIVQNPTGIQYNTAGTFDVSLTVTNSAGSNTITKTGFITVNPAPCLTPTGLNTTNITGTSATLNWNAVSGGLKYKVSYKTAGNNPWISTTVTNTFWQVTGLTPNSQYLWKVKTVCGSSISSPFSPNQGFTTSPARESGLLLNAPVSVYPNPVTDQFRISVSDQVSLPLTCTIYDLYGKAKLEVEVTDFQQMIKTSGLAAGNYFVTLIDGKNNRITLRMIKE